MVEWMTTREMEEYLKINRRTLYRWRGEVGMPHYLVGGAIRFDRSEVDDWVRNYLTELIQNRPPARRAKRGQIRCR